MRASGEGLRKQWNCRKKYVREASLRFEISRNCLMSLISFGYSVEISFKTARESKPHSPFFDGNYGVDQKKKLGSGFEAFT